MDRLRYFILSAADDYGGVGLWELSGVRFSERVGETFFSQDPKPRSEICPVLERLIKDGQLEMRDWNDPNRSFSLEEALNVIAYDTNWEWATRHCYALELTASAWEERRKGFEAIHGCPKRQE